MTSAGPLAEVARNSGFLRDLPEPSFLAAIQGLAYRRMAKGQFLISKGDPGLGLFVVASGAVKAASIDEQGREIVLDALGPGDVFGVLALLDGGPQAANITCIADGGLLFLPRSNFLRALRDPACQEAILSTLAGRLRVVNELLEERSFADTSRRLARAMIRLEIERRAGSYLPMNQQQLGSVVGLSRESTNRILRHWQREGLVSLQHGSITISSLPGLRRIAVGGQNGATIDRI